MQKDSDFGLTQMVPETHCKVSADLKMYDHCYYFSISCGIQSKSKAKNRVLFKEAQKSSSLAAGFDLLAGERLNLCQDMKNKKRHERQPFSFKKWLVVVKKIYSNLICFGNTSVTDEL